LFMARTFPSGEMARRSLREPSNRTILLPVCTCQKETAPRLVVARVLPSGRNRTISTTCSCPSREGLSRLPLAASQRGFVQGSATARALPSGEKTTQPRGGLHRPPSGRRHTSLPVSASQRMTEPFAAAARVFPQGEKRREWNSPGRSSCCSPVGTVHTHSRLSGPSTLAEARRFPSGEKASVFTSPWACHRRSSRPPAVSHRKSVVPPLGALGSNPAVARVLPSEVRSRVRI